jgi:acid phosphatase class B
MTTHSPEVVTFDFDDTILMTRDDSDWGVVQDKPNKNVIKDLHYWSRNADRIYIVTSRYRNREGKGHYPKGHPAYRTSIEDFLKEQGIYVNGVYFTNGKLKAPTLQKLGSELHYDDDPEEIRVAKSAGIKTVEVRGGAIHKKARRPTPQSQQFNKDIKAEKKHIQEALREFKRIWKSFGSLADEAKRAHPGNEPIDLARRKRTMIKLLKNSAALNTYLDQYVGTVQENRKAEGWRSQVRYQLRDMHLQPGHKLRDALTEVEKYAWRGFRSLEIAKSQETLRESLPDALRAFLPQNIVIETDPNGVITKVTDRFENEHETLEKKISRMHLLMKRYNKVVRQVKKDLKSSDERTKLSALVTSIIMETGIRPGKAGNGVVKVVNGSDLLIETFGAITLGPSHVNFVRDGFVRLKFPGKKTTENVATLSNKQIISILQDYVAKAQKGGNKYIFILKNGTPYTYTDCQRYFRETTALTGIKPTDFRKLKATEAILEGLHDEQQELYKRIKGFAKGQKKNLKERIVEEIVATMQRVYEKAQKSLSHEDVATTIRSYVNPEIVLRFLSQGRMDTDLGDAILKSKPVLQFDPMAFLSQAMGKTALKKLATLENLLEELEDQMEQSGVSVPRVAMRWLEQELTNRITSRWVQSQTGY